MIGPYCQYECKDCGKTIWLSKSAEDKENEAIDCINCKGEKTMTIQPEGD